MGQKDALRLDGSMNVSKTDLMNPNYRQMSQASMLFNSGSN